MASFPPGIFMFVSRAVGHPECVFKASLAGKWQRRSPSLALEDVPEQDVPRSCTLFGGGGGGVPWALLSPKIEQCVSCFGDPI